MLKVLRQYFKVTDKIYILLCLSCSIFSVLTLISIGKYQLGGFEYDSISGAITGIGGYRQALVQAGASLLGILCALLLSSIDYRDLIKIWPFHTVFTWGLVLPTLVLHNVKLGPLTIGYDAGGTDNYSWYRLGSLTLQPTELAKISFILTLAMHLDHAKEHINEPATLAKLLAHILIPVGLIHIQGDDGTAIIFAAIGCVMLFAAGLSWRYIGGAAAAALSVSAIVVGFFRDKVFKSYQFARIMAVIYPDDPAYARYTYQQNKGVISIGSGQIFGRGLFGENHNVVPNVWNDFIFSYMAEAVGFVGCLVILGVLFSIAFKTLATGLRSEDQSGSYICIGIFAAMFFQITINLGMNLQVLPVIGVTLPFFSAGGSSVTMLYLCVGVVLSVYLHNKKNLFE